MAKDKKSFILYADQKELFEQLPNDKAGELIKFIFSYVNDENPTTEDLVIKMAFTPIKQQFIRDLEKWKKTKEGRSIAGKASAEARRNKKEQSLTNLTNVEKVQQTSTNLTDNVNVNVNVNDNVNVNVNEINKKNIFNFRKSLISNGADENLANEWIKVRKSKKATNSQIALNDFLSQVNKSQLDINKALEQCVINSWKGFKADWVKDMKPKNTIRALGII